MSLDLHVYAPVSIDQEVLQDSVAELADVRIVSSSPAELSSFVIERQLRGRFEYLATVDGPFTVEPEDLPGVVAANALGVRIVHHIVVEGSSQAGFKIAQRIARLVASSCSGVVFDPQLDVVVWPRGRHRSFEPPKEATIDVVNFSWYVRRADAPADIAALFLDQASQLLPEAIPRRFGGYEPLQHKFETVGVNGFVESWRGESSILFWKGTARPCFGGSASGLGEDPGWRIADTPVGSISLSIDGRVFDDDRWRTVLVDFFMSVSRVCRSFAAVADVSRNVVLSRGSLSYAAESVTRWGLASRGEWLGFPPDQPWLLWVDGRYTQFLGLDGGEQSVLLRTSERPASMPQLRRLFTVRRPGKPDAYPIPAAARMTSTGAPGKGGERQRAATVPDWL